MRLIAKHLRFSIARNQDCLPDARVGLRSVFSFPFAGFIVRSSGGDTTFKIKWKGDIVKYASVVPCLTDNTSRVFVACFKQKCQGGMAGAG